MIGVCRKPVKASPPRRTLFPDDGFARLHTAQSDAEPHAFARGSLDSLDHVVIVVPKNAASRRGAKLPLGRQVERLIGRALRRGNELASTRADNGRATGITVAAFGAAVDFRRPDVGEKSAQRMHARQAR